MHRTERKRLKMARRHQLPAFAKALSAVADGASDAHASTITLAEHLRRIGSITSAKKARASRRNAKLGGKPPKFTAGDQVVVSADAAVPVKRRGMTGRIVGPAKSRAYYRVKFDDTILSLPSWWLERASQ